MTPIHDILQQHFGHANFRPQQEDIINAVLQGNDVLALLPTGGGKSLCYQVPALAKDGLCLVISPLIALMKDQVDHLRRKKYHRLFITQRLIFLRSKANPKSRIRKQLQVFVRIPGKVANNCF